MASPHKPAGQQCGADCVARLKDLSALGLNRMTLVRRRWATRIPAHNHEDRPACSTAGVPSPSYAKAGAETGRNAVAAADAVPELVAAGLACLTG